jgi:Family of unknown function (DUF6644)
MSILSICQALENTWLGTAVREQVYFIPQIFHLLGMALFGGAVVFDDLRLIGGVRHPAFSELSDQLLPWKWAGFVVVVASGFVIFMSDATRLYRNVGFQIKMILLLLIAVNAWIFRSVIYPDVRASEKSGVTPAPAKAAAYISLILWIGVIIASRVIGFVGPEY